MVGLYLYIIQLIVGLIVIPAGVGEYNIDLNHTNENRYREAARCPAVRIGGT